MIDEGDIPSIHCKMSLRGPNCMRKVDGLSLIFIGFYVPVLTPRLNNTETLFQLSENRTLFAVCPIYTGVIGKDTCLGYPESKFRWATEKKTIYFQTIYIAV
jgi:hypothetical protein